MTPRTARYLLRFDDLCPTMDRSRWEQILLLLREFNIRPILAVVPENEDPALNLGPPDPGFWEGMRELEMAGATIALHGYRHACRNRGKSLVPLHEMTEFAGVPEQMQQDWIASGLQILRSHSLNPRIWVAPRHGFDRQTLCALQAEGVLFLSDGFARIPFRRSGLIWIPQQLWAPVEKPRGLWTICLHSNTISDAALEQLRNFLVFHERQFSTVDRALAEYSAGKLPMMERLYALVALQRLRARKRVFGT